MRAPAFWDDERMDWRAVLLLPPALIYSIIAARRLRRKPEWRAPAPVFCIGNPTVGGTGKTPVATFVAGRLGDLGRKPVILSRGYGASVKRPVTVNIDRHSASDVGDEPLIHAHHTATVVSPDRVAGAMRAVKLGDVIVMDDGFQNPTLSKDCSILVVDAEAGLGNGMPIPAGPLRAPLVDQLMRADALMLMGEGDRAEFVERAAQLLGRPVLRAHLAPAADVAARLLGQPVIAYAGIGRPAKFFATVERIGARLAHVRGFPDHHPFTEAEATELLALARREDAILVTTEKDMMRLEGAGGLRQRLAAETVMLPVQAVLETESSQVLDGLIRSVLARY